ncbi:MAG: EF-P lysine aminoacylase GenX [Planctomycetales bacterium]|nr:EF-P lysine aminoacylase GenX [Planctomycetales bacterium]
MDDKNWRPTSSLEALGFRSEILWKMRSFFHNAGFWEVQTPILSRDTVIDRHIDPIVLPGASLALAGFHDQPLFLQTSPEFALKRLLAAGAQAIYQLGPVFRAGERGQFHNPEFTMLEWYRVGDGLEQAVEFLSQLVAHLVDQQPEIVTYRAVFERHTGIDPAVAEQGELAEFASSNDLGVSTDWTDDQDAWFDLIFSEIVQPQLGIAAPTVVTHYPASQAALARLSSDAQSCAERFELFIQGIELANGYHELLDPSELERRNLTVQAQRMSDGKPPLPGSSHLLNAMRSGLPACSGCALGVDRLILALLGANNIDNVLTFPIERA